VTVLTRGQAGMRAGVPHQHWDPSPGAAASAVFSEEYDAVVNLSGEPAVGVRYSERVKAGILNSRVDTTRWLVRAIQHAELKPKVFVCASGTGFYGSSLSSTRVDESAPAGSDFLALVCVAWEAAARGAEEFGVRVVSARIAPVLGEQGGALEALLRPFKWFVGGPIGSGRQGFSWLHIDDLVAALLRTCDDSALRGPVNFCAPNPLPNLELSRIIADLLGRPALLKAPGFVLKALFAEGAEPLLGGHFAVPHALERVGFEFRYADVRSALTAILRATN